MEKNESIGKENARKEAASGKSEVKTASGAAEGQASSGAAEEQTSSRPAKEETTSMTAEKDEVPGAEEKETDTGFLEDNAVPEEDGNGSGAAEEKGKGLLFRLMTSEGMRYLFIGGCTTMVNLVVYAVLCHVVHLNVNVSNIISIAVAILFAYVTNKLIVFRSHCGSFSELAMECARFIGARLTTMVIEVGGVFLLYEVAHQNEMVAKLATQVLVVIGNYFISRFIVFRDRK